MVDRSPKTHLLSHLSSKNHHQRLEYLQSRPGWKPLKVLSRVSAGVYCLKNQVIWKILPKNPQGYILWKNELKALTKLQGCPHFPVLIAFDPKTLSLYMNYCGPSLEDLKHGPSKPSRVSISQTLIRHNWMKQWRNIKRTLKKTGIVPADILNRNICIKNGVIHIIDFGLSNTKHSLDKDMHTLQRLLQEIV